MSLELGSAGNNAHAATARAALWSCPIIEGPWTEPSDIGQTAACADPTNSPFGLLTSSLIGHPLPFRLWLISEQRAPPLKPPADPQEVRIEFGLQTQQPSDWITLDIPASALAAVWPVNNTWSVAENPWLIPLCCALADVADHVHARAPILGGVMGEEASGCWRVPTQTRVSEAEQGYPPLAVLTAEVIEERGGFVVTPELWRQLTQHANMDTRSSGLIYAALRLGARLTGA